MDDQKTRVRDFLWTTKRPEDQREIPWTTRRPERDSLDDQKTRARGSFGRPEDQNERFSLDDQRPELEISFGRPEYQKTRVRFLG